MNILVIGSGMYVTGRNNSGTGTIISSLVETSKEEQIDNIIFVSNSAKSEGDVQESMIRIQKVLNQKVPFSFYSFEKDGDQIITKLHEECNFRCAIISVPDHLHFTFGIQCLELGIHTLIVKPLTPTLAEAKELNNKAKEKNVFGCVEFHKRYDETNLWIKQALERGELGKISYFTVDYSQRISIPTETFKGWADKTNIFQYLGVHYVDLIYWLTKAIPVRISATGVLNGLTDLGLNTYDSVHCNIEWASEKYGRFTSIHNTNWIDPNISSAMSDQKYKVIGQKGRIECDQKNRGVEIVTDSTGIQQINPYFSDYLPDENGHLKFNGYGHKSIRQFILDVNALEMETIDLNKLTQNRPSFQESLISTAVIEAGNNSLGNSGEWQTINL